MHCLKLITFGWNLERTRSRNPIRINRNIEHLALFFPSAGEMSVEELMKKYSGAYDSDFEMPEESSEDNGSDEEESSGGNYFFFSVNRDAKIPTFFFVFN